jgi:hypothetical protein
MVPEQAPDRPLGLLNAVQSAVGIAAFAIAIVAVVFGGDGSVPGWLGLIVTIGVGIISAFAVRWYRRRPIEVGNWKSYQDTVLVRFAISAETAAIGAVMTFVGDSVWPAVVGGVFAIINLALAPASADDYLRHQLIYVEENTEVPEEKWGEADPEAVTPWEQLEEGHGHGLSH